MIMVDAYQDITIPFQLSSVEFFTEVSEHLKENGVMVVNLNMASDQEGSINDYLCDTMASVFRHVYTADVPGNTNREVFCTNSDDLPAVFEASRAQLEQEDYAEIMDNVSADLVEYQAGDLILTDDKAPVELLGMQVLDEIIADELAYYKGLFTSGELNLGAMLG